MHIHTCGQGSIPVFACMYPASAHVPFLPRNAPQMPSGGPEPARQPARPPRKSARRKTHDAAAGTGNNRTILKFIRICLQPLIY